MVGRCYDRTDRYRPQGFFETPSGYRDEVFILGPFPLPISQTGQLTFNLPVQMEDDVEFIIRAMMLAPQFGTLDSETPGGPAQGMLVRIRDCWGNSLCGSGMSSSGSAIEDFVLGMGIWCNQAGNGVNAFGFVMEPELPCPPGGTMLFDFQAPSGGQAAFFTFTIGPESITFEAAVGGAAGNGFTIHLVDPGAPNVPLSVAVVGTAVTVTLATDGGSAITSTFQDVQNIVNLTPAVQAVMFAILTGSTPLAVVTALATTPLAGGVNGAVTTFFGTFIGVKRFRECL